MKKIFKGYGFWAQGLKKNHTCTIISMLLYNKSVCQKELISQKSANAPKLTAFAAACLQKAAKELLLADVRAAGPS